jgi:undecaprenyl-diphosphatase
LTPTIALLLGIVEGLTEYLPVSSTGHLHLAGLALGLRGEPAKSFEIVIQLGAILAVLVHYRRLLAERVVGLARGDDKAKRLFAALAIAFVPAAVVGVLLRHTIKERLFGLEPIAGALIVGGVVMIVVELARRRRGVHGLDGLEHVDARRALVIGLGQVLSLWPGASRSMCTIVAGQLSGLSTATAAEFSFLLGLPTLGAATLYEGYKARHELFASGGALPLAIGLVTSFVVAWAVIAAFLRYLKSYGLAPFGVYRVVVGGLALWLALR